MTLLNNNASTTKTNLYRAGVDQPPVNQATDTPTAYCQNLVTVGQQRTQLDKNLTVNGASPSAAMATNLFTFLANRLNQSFTNLGCMNLLHMNNPVTITLNGAGVATAATFAAAGTPVTTCGPTPPTATSAPAATGPTSTAPIPGTPTSTTGTPTSTGNPTSTAGTPMDNAATATTPITAPTTAPTCVPGPTDTPTTDNADANAANNAPQRPTKY
jgi:hypothetical protein